ncbi:MAG: TfoX/Sxy family protein [Desulfomonile tiedjei]|uniref:TfoX/Sxy family protein n=1 Tax=Desulfomonile tiedjei TaxID=2358 RepID=A0A9D6V0Z8_9BACT|nr:TfoX/Sxy family protein [Desulfomonile tiedjei]
MSYSESLDNRISEIVTTWENITRRKMFGGICYLLNGNMFSGVYKDYLILRLGEKEASAALELPPVRPCDITGRPMKGWVMVEERGFAGPKLTEWLQKARLFVETLPAK